MRHVGRGARTSAGQCLVPSHDSAASRPPRRAAYGRACFDGKAGGAVQSPATRIAARAADDAGGAKGPPDSSHRRRRTSGRRPRARSRAQTTKNGDAVAGKAALTRRTLSASHRGRGARTRCRQWRASPRNAVLERRVSGVARSVRAADRADGRHVGGSRVGAGQDSALSQSRSRPGTRCRSGHRGGAGGRRPSQLPRCRSFGCGSAHVE